MDRLPSSTPSWLRSALARGLSIDREDRFETMHDLAAALDSNATRSRRRRWVLGGVAVVVLGALALRQSPEAVETCPDARPQLEGIWNDGRRDQIRTALTQAAPSYAEAMLGTIEGRLDAYADAWVDGHRDACEATHVRREQSDTLLDARVRCLTDRRRRLDATVETLVDADAKVAEKAIAAVEDLPAIAGCADLERVQALHPIPDDPKLAAAVDEQLEQMAQARTLIAAGRYGEASEIALASIERARELEYPPLSARAQGLLGWAAEQQGDAETATGHLEAAYEDGRRTGQSEVAADAAATLAYLLARYSQQPEQANPWAKIATLEGELLERPDLQAAGLNAVGIAAARTDDLAAADTHFEAAVEMQSQLGESAVLVAYRTNRARAARHAGRLQDAADAAASNLAAAEALLGPQHPGLITHIDLLSEMLIVLGEPARGRELLERGVAIAKRAYGPKHPTTARLLEVLGSALLTQGKLADARSVLEEAVTLTEAPDIDAMGMGVMGLKDLGTVYILQGEVELGLETLRRDVDERVRVSGAESRDTAVSRGTLARALLEAGRPTEALPLANAAVTAIERLRGPTHVDVAEGLWIRARAEAELGKLDAAATDLERAIEIVDAGFRPGSSQRAEGRIRLGEVRLRQGRAADAVELAERALDSLAEPPARAPALFLLARAIVQSDGDRERALKAAGEAETGFRALPDVANADAVAAWISANF